MNTPRLKPGAGLGLLWMLYVADLMEHGARHELEAPGPHWWPCADMHETGSMSRYCRCRGPEICGGCCGCLGGCIARRDEAEHWAKRLREMSGELEPCNCRPVWNDNGDGWAPSSTSVYTITPSCPHHGDARHVCNVSALGRSKHMEGAGWRCPPCGATWVLTRVQGAEQPVRLYPTMQWIRSALEKA